jgi:uncharacterized protein YcfL
MKKVILSLIVIVFLAASCRSPHTCVCTILQPNINAITTAVEVDNTEIKAFSICTSKSLTIANTATTTCVILAD